eukprot:UN23107
MIAIPSSFVPIRTNLSMKTKSYISWISIMVGHQINPPIFGLTPTPYTNSSSLINSVVKKISKYKCSFPC